MDNIKLLAALATLEKALKPRPPVDYNAEFRRQVEERWQALQDTKGSR